MRKLLPIIPLSLLAAGCAVRAEYHPICGVKLPAKLPEQVEVLQAMPRRSWVPLGEFVMSGDAGADYGALTRDARAKAAALGADFICVTEKGAEQGGYGAPGYKPFTVRGYGAKNWITGGSASREGDGTELVPIVNALAGAYTPSKLGLMFDDAGRREDPEKYIVSGFEPGSRAGEAGLRAGDRLIAIDGFDMSDLGERGRHELELMPGGRTRCTVLRDGRKMEFRVERIAN